MALSSAIMIQINKPLEKGAPFPAEILVTSGSTIEHPRISMQIELASIGRANEILGKAIQRVTRSYHENLRIDDLENAKLMQDLLEAGRAAFEEIVEDSTVRGRLIEKLHSNNGGLTITVMFDRQQPISMPWEFFAYGHSSAEPLYSNFWGYQHTICRQAFSGYANFGQFGPSPQPRVALLACEGLPSIDAIKRPVLLQLAARGEISYIDFARLVSQTEADDRRRQRRLGDLLAEKNLRIADFACRIIPVETTRQSIPCRVLLADNMELGLNEIRKALHSSRGKPIVLLNLRPEETISATQSATFPCSACPTQFFYWVDMFLELGAAGVIATDCGIPDPFAATFAEGLYQHLVSGFSVGDALLKTRHEMLEKYQNPLALAYTLYGDPDKSLFVYRADGEARYTSPEKPMKIEQEAVMVDEYRDLALYIGPNGHARAVYEGSERKATISLDIPTDVTLTIKLIEQTSTDADLLKQFGKRLYEIIFPAQIDKHFNVAEAASWKDDKKVRIRLIIEPDALAQLPWEFLYREEGEHFLATNPGTVLSHYLDLPWPPGYVRERQGPLHILTIISNPNDQPTQLDIDNWDRIVRKALSKPLKAGLLTLKTVKQATYEKIRDALLERSPDIVQFVGHGVYHEGKGYLALVGENGGTWIVDDERFAAIFADVQDRLGLVCLATCESAKSDSPKSFLGIAPRLVQRGTPAVVAMRYPVLVSTAEIFLDNFYTLLAARKPVDWAVQSARNAIAIKVGLGNREFATPVLFMRAKDGSIF